MFGKKSPECPSSCSEVYYREKVVKLEAAEFTPEPLPTLYIWQVRTSTDDFHHEVLATECTNGRNDGCYEFYRVTQGDPVLVTYVEKPYIDLSRNREFVAEFNHVTSIVRIDRG